MQDGIGRMLTSLILFDVSVYVTSQPVQPDLIIKIVSTLEDFNC